jgi:hypothetical protein
LLGKAWWKSNSAESTCGWALPKGSSKEDAEWQKIETGNSAPRVRAFLLAGEAVEWIFGAGSGGGASRIALGRTWVASTVAKGTEDQRAEVATARSSAEVAMLVLGDSSPIINGIVAATVMQCQSLQACDHPAVPRIKRSLRVSTIRRTNHWAKGAQSCADCATKAESVQSKSGGLVQRPVPTSFGGRQRDCHQFWRGLKASSSSSGAQRVACQTSGQAFCPKMACGLPKTCAN